MVNTVSSMYPEYPVGWYTGFIDSIPAAMYRATIEGKLIFCNRTFAQLFGFVKAEELIDYPVVKLYKNCKDRGFLIDNVTKQGSVKDLPLYLVKQNSTPMFCSVSAQAVLDDDGVVVYLDGVIRVITDTEAAENHSITMAQDNTGETEGGLHLTKFVAQEATKQMKHQKHQLSKERLLGVMEMAGGVAHTLNQPLTIISNLLHEVLSGFDPNERNYGKIVKIDAQIKKLNEIVKKIGSINQYEAMEYVAGVRIVDIDKASRMKRGGEVG
jgi:signal transduction histidine kinase